MEAYKDVFKRAIEISKYEIYVPVPLRKYVKTEKTPAGTRLKRK